MAAMRRVGPNFGFISLIIIVISSCTAERINEMNREAKDVMKQGIIDSLKLKTNHEDRMNQAPQPADPLNPRIPDPAIRPRQNQNANVNNLGNANRQPVDRPVLPNNFMQQQQQGILQLNQNQKPQNVQPMQVQPNVVQGEGQANGQQNHMRQGNPNLAAVNKPAVPKVNDQAGNGQQRTAPMRLAETSECSSQVKQYCSQEAGLSNFGVLECLQYDKHDVSEECQNVLWHYKDMMSRDIRFDSANQEVCKDSLERLPECNALPKGQGLVIPCLIENKANITGDSCRQFLTKMASIIFSDYRLISKLADACRDDISQTECGRLHPEGDHSPHTQGKTIECLSDKLKSLSHECKHEIMRVAELQSEDFHEDRPLYYSCREDRERFCARTKAGNGRVYRCLYRHKFEKDMSSNCQAQLTRRQTLMQSDYKVNKVLADSCRADIKTYHCLRNQEVSTKHGRLSTILLCLEGAMHDGNPVTPECIGELREMRRALMEDYKISPNVVSACEEEIQNQCNGLDRNGKTLHCLMDLARPKARLQKAQRKSITGECRAELDRLIEEADAGEDVRVDPYLSDSCAPVMETVCKNIKPGEARMMECLMEHMDSPQMTDECEERLIELQFFISREFRLDPRLYKYCHRDANEKCNANQKWDRSDSMSPEQGPLIFHCLYKHMKHPTPEARLARPCEFEIRRIMRERAVSVDLEPRIEDACLDDLGYYCSEDVEKGNEMECLQDNLEKLDEKCRMAVGNFTEDEDEDPQLDRILMKACAKPIKDFCHDLLDDANAEPGDLMECLIENKDDHEMNKKCKAGIEHHQLTSLKDFRFSYKFKEECKKDVMSNCKHARAKPDVVKCLSEIVRNDTLLEKDHRLTLKCRKQLKVELFNREENIDLDPELKQNCNNDISNLCSNVSPGNAAVLQCLKKNQQSLSRTCRKQVFQREELEAKDPSISFNFVMSCKRMIKRYCLKEQPNDILKCLKDYKDELDFDDKCKKAITQKQITQNQDIRLNPELNAACRLDVQKFCKVELMNRNPDQDNEGVIINCLKKQFPIHRLSKSCEDHIASDIKEAAEDVRMDPVLNKACKVEISTMCKNYAPDLEECLKMKYATGEIKSERCKEEVGRLLVESRADIHVDPLLFKACTLDIKHYCYDVPAGEGRQMSCMLAALSDKSIRLSLDCKKKLEERVEMWEYAAKLAPPETAQELLQQIYTSNSRTYFAMIIFSIIGFIFFGGICMGRVTKRLRAEIKDR